MSDPFCLKAALCNADATARFAASLAPFLQPGDVILLEGPIGAGKSHFARALIQTRLAAIDRSEDIPSPTFTLVQTYEASPCDIWHADLYRLTDPNEIDELGLVDAFASEICLVEWPDRLGSLAPHGALTLALAPGEADDTRRLTLRSEASRWAAPCRTALGQTK